MPSPKTPYANATPKAPKPPAPTTNPDVLNQASRRQLDYLDTDAPAAKAPAPRPVPAPAAKPKPRREPNWTALEEEAEKYRKRPR